MIRLVPLVALAAATAAGPGCVPAPRHDRGWGAIQSETRFERSLYAATRRWEANVEAATGLAFAGIGAVISTIGLAMLVGGDESDGGALMAIGAGLATPPALVCFHGLDMRRRWTREIETTLFDEPPSRLAPSRRPGALAPKERIR